MFSSPTNTLLSRIGSASAKRTSLFDVFDKSKLASLRQDSDDANVECSHDPLAQRNSQDSNGQRSRQDSNVEKNSQDSNVQCSNRHDSITQSSSQNSVVRANRRGSDSSMAKATRIDIDSIPSTKDVVIEIKANGTNPHTKMRRGGKMDDEDKGSQATRL